MGLKDETDGNDSRFHKFPNLCVNVEQVLLGSEPRGEC